VPPAGPIATLRQIDIFGLEPSPLQALKGTQTTVASSPVFVKTHSRVRSKNKIGDCLASLYDEPAADIRRAICENAGRERCPKSNPDNHPTVKAPPAGQLSDTAYSDLAKNVLKSLEAGCSRHYVITPERQELEEKYKKLVEHQISISYDWTGTSPFNILDGLLLQLQVGR
jgi:hypothetical protein